MTRSSFHFRAVSGSPDLQRVVDLLKGGPHTTMEGIKAAGIAAFSACVSEINHNDGYSIGRVMRMEGKKQVHTYVLLQAPGWRPRWRIEGNNIVGINSAFRTPHSEFEDAPAKTEPETLSQTSEQPGFSNSALNCKLHRCGMPIPPDRIAEGSEYCCKSHADEAIKEIREATKAAIIAKQGDMFNG